MGKAILIVPHPDDEIINYAPFLNDAYQSILVTTPADDRSAGFVKLMKNFKIDYTCLGFTDGWLLSYDRKYVESHIRNAILNGGYYLKKDSYFVLPSPFDDHPEHTLISLLGTYIATTLNKSVCYSSNLDGEDYITVFNKKDLLNEYYPGIVEKLDKSGFKINIGCKIDNPTAIVF